MSQVHADGAFKIKLNGKSFIASLEYEATAKSNGRIRDKLFEYFSLTGVRAVFYICKSTSIEASIRQMEKEVFKDGSPRIYYAQLDHIHSTQGKVTFTNSHQGQFHLE